MYFSTIVVRVSYLDRHSPDVESVSAEVLHALFFAEADVHVGCNQTNTLEVTEFVVKLFFQLVNDFWDRDVAKHRVVARIEHDRVRLNGIQPDNMTRPERLRAGHVAILAWPTHP